MKRKHVLKAVHNFLVEQEYTGSLLEILIEPQAIDDEELLFRRSVLFTGIDDTTPFLNKIRQSGISIQEQNTRYYSDVDELLESDLIDLEDMSLENNWRCRILRNNIDLTVETPDLVFRRNILNSYWRLIITKHDGQYFSKYNLHPVFYYPGDSVGGTDDYRYGINHFVEYILKSKKLDPNFDLVKFFSVNRHFEETGSSFRVIDPFEDDGLYIREFLEMLRPHKKEVTIRTIEDAYNTAWS